MNETFERLMYEFGFDQDENQYDIEELKKTGVVTETEVEEGNLITKVMKYVSHDGKCKITSQVCYSKTYLLNKENRELRKQIQEAVALENYELAAELKNKLHKK
jgi:hypothetical protein